MSEFGVARRRVEIVNAYGLHMRPANKFVKLANSFQSNVWVNHGPTRASGKSILDMSTLAAECGATLDLEARGPDAEEALSALADLVAAGFHMTEEDYCQQAPGGQAGGNSPLSTQHPVDRSVPPRAV
jgi:phosphocarrier protein HPr